MSRLGTSAVQIFAGAADERAMRRVSYRFRTMAALGAAASALLVAGAPATAAGLRVNVTGTSTKPKVGDRWTLTVAAPGAKSGKVRVDVLMGGKVVQTVANGEPLRGGKWSITQKWPGIAKGRTMVVRGTVTSGKRRGSGQLKVTVRG